MNKTEAFKKALKTAFLKEYLPQELSEDVAKYLSINDKGEITFKDSSLFQSQKGLSIIHKLINELASKWADESVELWLKTQTDKKG